jgi:hypothetical protein
MPDYYYLNSDNQPVGPMDLAAIRKLAGVGIVGPDVLVCEAGHADWTPLSQKQDPASQPEAPKPPRTPPPAQRPQRTIPTPQRIVRASAPTYPDWFPIASMVAGIVAIITLWAPLLSILIGAAALTLGILGYRLPEPKGRPFCITGISVSSVALVVSLGIILSGASAGFTGTSEARAVERVLERGIRVDKDAEKRFSGDAPAIARHYARELQRIDTRDCPLDFRVAYQDLVAAWESAIPYLDADTPLTSFFEGFFGGLTNDYSGVGFSNHQARLALQQIHHANQSLHRIAVAHGARIPTR